MNSSFKPALVGKIWVEMFASYNHTPPKPAKEFQLRWLEAFIPLREIATRQRGDLVCVVAHPHTHASLMFDLLPGWTGIYAEKP